MNLEHIKKLAHQIKQEFKVDHRVALEAAIQIERNEILKQAFIAAYDQDAPQPLEMIAVELLNWDKKLQR